MLEAERSGPCRTIRHQVDPGTHTLHQTPTTVLAAGAASQQRSMMTTSTSRTSEREGKPDGAQADKATQVHLEFTNNTHQVLTLVTASRGGSTAHWQTRPPTTPAARWGRSRSSYAAADASINLVHQGTEGAVFALTAKTPLVGDNSATGETDSTSYTVATAGSWYNPTDHYAMNAGHTSTSTGQPETFTVPVG